MEVGIAPDFACGQDAPSLARCQAHFTLWTIMKAVLLMGNVIPEVDNATLGVLTNPFAIAVNQDPLGIQGRRVAVQTPANVSLGGIMDNIAVVRTCNASIPTQTWHWVNASRPVGDVLSMTPCDAGNRMQSWSLPTGSTGVLVQNNGNGLCVVGSNSNPAQLTTCVALSVNQNFALQSDGHLYSAADNVCLDVVNFVGPNVQGTACKAPGANDTNQVTTTEHACARVCCAVLCCLYLCLVLLCGVRVRVVVHFMNVQVWQYNATNGWITSADAQLPAYVCASDVH